MNSTDKVHGYRAYGSHKAVEKKSDALKAYRQLCKIKIAVFAALSAATGSILVTGEMTSAMLIAMAGVFFLACGAGALNQYQERDIDALMIRTQSRPIPAGDIKASHAINVAAVLFIIGFSALALLGNFILLGLGLFAIIWYNLVYTSLKRVTAFAAVPGAIVGAIPPVIGWLAAGGSLNDRALLPLCFFFFMWQVPHFWFLLFSHEEDYKRSDLPTPVKIFNRDQFCRIAITWTMAAAVSCFLIPLFGMALSDSAVLLLCLAAAWLIWKGVRNLWQSRGVPAYSPVFKSMNIYMLIVMAVLNVERLLNL
jgi:protoheme IX farnesyltransferase